MEKSYTYGKKVYFAIEEVLKKILDEQNNGSQHFPPYSKALEEIQNGEKTSHWIWYVWPAHKKLRSGTSRPEFLLKSLEMHEKYLGHPTLYERLIEITKVATEKLTSGVKPRKLFGSEIDYKKFKETTTLFFIVSFEEYQNPKYISKEKTKEAYVTFRNAIIASNKGNFDQRTMIEVINKNQTYKKYNEYTKANDVIESYSTS